LDFVDNTLGAPGMAYNLLTQALEVLGIPENLHGRIITAWKAAGRLQLGIYAPYANHVVRVEMFFFMALARELIAPHPNTNKIDISYLYYLPFCKVFTSGDKFHSRIATLFLQPDQMFVKPDELKADLKMIADMWDATDKSAGTANFIRHPPRGKGLVSERIWDHCIPNWREWADTPPPERSPESDAETMKRIRPMMEAIEAYQKRKRRNPDDV